VPNKKMSDANLYKLIGNAVSVPVVSLIAERLINAIRHADSKK
jgi:site-specific DNA-cytosine methylase